MLKFFTSITLFICFVTTADSQYSVKWAKTLGGTDWDEATCVTETLDKGIVIGGYKEGGGQNFGVSGYVKHETRKGEKYPWLVKIDAVGDELWGRTYEDSLFAEIRSIAQLPDSGILAVGIAYPKKKFSSDLWMMKVDKDGKKLWEKNMGSIYYDEGASSVTLTSDGGFVIAAFSARNEEMKHDFWILKFDSLGNKMWDQIWGGVKEDFPYQIIETADNGLAVAGYNMSKGGGFKSLWVMKYDAHGNWEWDDFYRHSPWDAGTAITSTYDGGLAVAGYTKSEGIVNYDIRIIKLDDMGELVWDRIYGGYDWEEATGIVETFDKGLALSGFTKNINGYYDDFWIMYLDRDGALIWEQIYGGSSFDFANAIIETSDRGLVVVGCTYAGERLGWDYAILKFERDGLSDYLLPRIKMEHPQDTLINTYKQQFNIKACIQSIDTVQRVSIYLNDSLLIENANLIENPADTLCAARINEIIPLTEGKNEIIVEAENEFGKTFSDVFIVYFVMLLKTAW